MKQLMINFKWVPEFYFILVSILWYYYTVNPYTENMAGAVNFPAVLLIVLFHIQLFLNDKLFAQVLSVLTAVGTFYLIYTLFVWMSALYQFDRLAQLHLLQIGNLILMNFIMSFFLFKKYNNVKTEANLLELSSSESNY